MEPIPTSLAGYQLLCNSVVQKGDLLIPEGALSSEEWVWAAGAVGLITGDTGAIGGGSYRVYRKSSPPRPGDLDRSPSTGKTYGQERAESVLKDSGERRSFGTGSVRDAATGKGCPHLLPLRAITLAAQQMERGKVKYGARNWELGQPLSSYFDSAQRHLWKHWQGWTDEPHLDAFVWNSLCYAETCERIRLGILPKELDDRPTVGAATPQEMSLTG